jgi:hypothetical protein
MNNGSQMHLYPVFGLARLGAARLGKAGSGQAGQGKAWEPMARKHQLID